MLRERSNDVTVPDFKAIKQGASGTFLQAQ
jgi:hypothetical protein